MTNSGKLRLNKPKMGKSNGGSKPPDMSVPWGRGASEHRPGLFTKQYLMEHAEGCVADIFYALRENLGRINNERIELKERPIRGGTYNSYAKYFFWYILMDLVEPTDRREPAIYAFLKERHYYRLTDKGKSEVRAWEDPIVVAHPEFR